MNRTSTRKVVPHACDACRRRKTKCTGQMPCPPCTSASLPCTFNTPQRKGGNRGARATTLNQLQEEYATTNRNGINIQGAGSESQHALSSINSILPHNLRQTGLESIAIDTCIEAYLHRIHPIVPLLNPDLLREEASKTTTSLISRQFILSFCAYVVTFGRVLHDSPAIPHADLGQQLVKSTLEIQNADRITRPCGLSVYISFFLYGAHAGMGDYRQGWFYLRESTTLFTMQKAGDEWYDQETYRRLFWILLISERAHAIRRQRPITLLVTPTTPSPPLLSPSERGLHYLSLLFRPFDEAFFALWNFSRQECSKEWLIALETSIRTALPPPLLDTISHDQVANIRVSQLWLQIKLWELFPRFGYLSSSESVYECLTFRYPLGIARALMNVVEKLPRESLWVNGVGMTEKIFDITCALADVLPFLSPSSPLTAHEPDLLTPLTTLLSTLPSGRFKFLPLLLAKLHELQPNLVPALAEAARGLARDDGEDGEERRLLGLSVGGVMSPDTRFLYEEEVGRGLFADLRRGGGG